MEKISTHNGVSGQKGFGIAELLVVASIMSLAAILGGQFYNSLVNSGLQHENTVEAEILYSEIQSQLSSEALCTKLLIDKVLPQNSGDQQPLTLQWAGSPVRQVGTSLNKNLVVQNLSLTRLERLGDDGQKELHAAQVTVQLRNTNSQLGFQELRPRVFPITLVTERGDRNIESCYRSRELAQVMACPSGQIMTGFDANGPQCQESPSLGQCPAGQAVLSMSENGLVCTRPTATMRNPNSRPIFVVAPPPAPPPPPPPPPPEPTLSGADFTVPGTYQYQLPSVIPPNKRLRIEVAGAGGGGGGGHRETGGGGKAGSGTSIEIPAVAGSVFTIVVGRGGIGIDNERAGSPGELSSIRGPGLDPNGLIAAGGAGGPRDAARGNCVRNDPRTNGEAGPFGWAAGGLGGSCPIVFSWVHSFSPSAGNYGRTYEQLGLCFSNGTGPGVGGNACGSLVLGCPGQFGSGGGGGCDNYRGADGGHGRVRITVL